MTFSGHKTYLICTIYNLFYLDYLVAEQSETEILEYLVESEWGDRFEQEKENPIQYARQVIQDQLANLDEMLTFYQTEKQERLYKRPVFELGDTSTQRFHPNSSSLIADNLDSTKAFYLFGPNDSRITFFSQAHLQITNRAVDLLKEFSPNSYSKLFSFTQLITPIQEKGVVSYSSENIVGYSSINLFDRDFVDLLDDLVHENGHHMLNCLLASIDPIEEDDELIYYSPWRRAMRPIRGLYHAVFTFYHGLVLFSDLLENNIERELNPQEVEKVKLRFCEEFLMLCFCQKDIERGFEQGHISVEGKELMDFIYEDIERKLPLYETIKVHLADHEELKELELHLLKMAETYQ